MWTDEGSQVVSNIWSCWSYGHRKSYIYAHKLCTWKLLSYRNGSKVSPKNWLVSLSASRWIRSTVKGNVLFTAVISRHTISEPLEGWVSSNSKLGTQILMDSGIDLAEFDFWSLLSELLGSLCVMWGQVLTMSAPWCICTKINNRDSIRNERYWTNNSSSTYNPDSVHVQRS